MKPLRKTYHPLVDILFVIDDSGSMGQKQNILSKNSELFIDQFLKIKSIDYHIGVTSSSVNYLKSYRTVTVSDEELSSCDGMFL